MITHKDKEIGIRKDYYHEMDGEYANGRSSFGFYGYSIVDLSEYANNLKYFFSSNGNAYTDRGMCEFVFGRLSKLKPMEEVLRSGRVTKMNNPNFFSLDKSDRDFLKELKKQNLRIDDFEIQQIMVGIITTGDLNI